MRKAKHTNISIPDTFAKAIDSRTLPGQKRSGRVVSDLKAYTLLLEYGLARAGA
jgi:hypothetical protein